MHAGLFVTLVCIAAMGALMAAVTLGKRRRLDARLRRMFGTPPTQVNGLSGAEAFWAACKKAAPGAGATTFDVDNLTWSDLDLDDIYARTNACLSATGDVRLYTALRRLELDGEAQAGALARREALTELFAADEKLCHATRRLLARFGRFDGNHLEAAVFHADGLRLKNRWMYWLLGLLPFLVLPLFTVHVVGAVVALLAALWINFAVYIATRDRKDSGFRAVRYLASALVCARKLSALLGRRAPELAGELRGHAGRFSRMRVGIAILTFDKMIEDNIDFNPFWLIMLPLLAYGQVAAGLAGSGPDTLALYTLLGEIDLAQGVLSTRKSLPLWCRPQFTQDDRLAGENLYHPMLEDPVLNTADFESDVLLTGSNASGKSTFIKALAINCITAQGLNTCTAGAWVMHRGAVATSMAVADSVVDGDSYFVAEIKSMRRLLRVAEAEDFSLFFIDEILKGTNTVERIAASAAVLRQLHQGPCLCFAATHDIELTTILADIYDNYHFRENVTEEGVFFSYKLQEGPAQTRNAILLLERMDYPRPVTAAARALVAHFEQAGDWALPAPREETEDEDA